MTDSIGSGALGLEGWPVSLYHTTDVIVYLGRQWEREVPKPKEYISCACSLRL